MATTEIFIIGFLGLVLGAGIGYLIAKKTKITQRLASREINKVVNDPDLLLKKINKSRKIIDSGEEVSYEVEEIDGKKKLVEKRKPYKGKKEEPPKEIEEKVKALAEKADEEEKETQEKAG